MHFGEFNSPLDVLAAAATLQSSHLSSSSSSSGGADSGPPASDGQCPSSPGGGGAGDAGQEEGETDTDGDIGEGGATTETEDASPSVTSGASNDMTPQTTTVCEDAQDKKSREEVAIHRSSPSDDSLAASHTSPCVIKLVPKADPFSKPASADCVVKLRDPIKLAVTTRDSQRSFSALKIPKTEMGGGVDHSYAFTNAVPMDRIVGHSGKLETEDDGYCSRSSLDSPGQSSRSDGDTNDQDIFSDSDMKSPTNLAIPSLSLKAGIPSSTSTPLKLKTGVMPSSPQLSPQVMGEGKKPTKIVIVSRDAKRTCVVSPPSDCAPSSMDHLEEAAIDSDSTSCIPRISSLSPLQPPMRKVHTVMEPVDSWAGYSEPHAVDDKMDVTETVTVVKREPSPDLIVDEQQVTCDVVNSEASGSPRAILAADEGEAVSSRDESPDDECVKLETREAFETTGVTGVHITDTVTPHPESNCVEPIVITPISDAALLTDVTPASSTDSKSHAVKLMPSTSIKPATSPNAVFLVRSLTTSNKTGREGTSLSANKYIIEDDLPPVSPDSLTENAHVSSPLLSPGNDAVTKSWQLQMDEHRLTTDRPQLSQTLNSIVLAGPLVRPACSAASENPGKASCGTPRLDGSCKLLLVKQEPVGCDSRGTGSVVGSPLVCRTPSPMLSSAVLSRPVTPASQRLLDSSSSNSSSLSNNNNNSKINIKISGSKVIDVTCTDEQGVSVKKAAASIGRMGSLSWQPIASSSTDNTTSSLGTSSGTKENVPYLRILSGSPLPQKPLCPSPAVAPVTASRSATPTLQAPTKRPYNRRPKLPSTPTTIDLGDSGEAVSEEKEDSCRRSSCHTYVRKRQKVRGSGVLSPSHRELSKLKLSAQLIPHLHPLIHHDYCAFSHFSAEVQRSIIATTHNKVRIDKKFGKKAKAARTKGPGHNASTLPEDAASTAELPIVNLDQPKKRKYTKRKLTKKMLAEALANGEDISDKAIRVTKKDVGAISKAKEALLASKLRKRQLALEKKMSKYSPYRERPDKNYVKIPGSYQDDFVYYATRKTQKRQRKEVETLPDNLKGLPSKAHMVGAISEFDWYHEMARVDKTKFGVCSSIASDSNPGTPTPEAERAFLSVDKGSTMLSPKLEEEGRFLGSSMPPRECDVVDLVVDMELGNSNSTAVSLPSTGVEQTNGRPEQDLNMMAEQVRLMLNSMDETELQLLTENLESKDSKEAPASTVSAMLEQGAGLTQTTPSSQLLGDLDDINDSDLLSPDISSDIGNMSMEILDLHASSSITPVTSSMATAASGSRGPSYMSSAPVALSVSGSGLTRMDTSRPDTPSTPGTPLPTASSVAPELTMVNMYWNDLPGLTINGKQYVRLVDIHKQVLPAKDTGILKKRCQMMGLHILNCTDLQRDFLIRYMNAAKSKSCVITSTEEAKTLIGFYVDPRPRMPRGHAVECDSDIEHPENSAKAIQQIKPKERGVVIRNVGLPKQPAGTPHPSRLRKPSPRLPKKASVKRKPVLPAGLSDMKRSGLRQTPKVPYAALHHGVLEPSDDFPAEHREAENTPPIFIPTVEEQTPGVEKPKAACSGKEAPRKRMASAAITKKISTDAYRRMIQEDVEMRKLVTKKKRVGRLTKREQHRLLRLRERAKQRRMKMKVGDKEKDARHQENQAKWIQNLMKAREKQRLLQEAKVKAADDAGAGAAAEAGGDRGGKKQNGEHCYASWHAKLGTNTTGSTNKAALTAGEDDEEASPSEAVNLMEVTPPQGGGGDSGEENHDIDVVDSPAVSGDSIGQVASPETPPLPTNRKPSLAVTHRDQRTSRSKFQDGDLLLHLFKSRDSACVRCLACRELLSLRHFVKHLHRSSNPDDLMTVSVPHKLVMTSNEPSPEELALWERFQTTSKEYEQRKRQAASSKSSSTSSHSTPVKTPALVSKKQTPRQPTEKLPSPVSTPSPASNAANTRHSTRIRKRKQFHPMESYVFNDGSDESALKRPKADA